MEDSNTASLRIPPEFSEKNREIDGLIAKTFDSLSGRKVLAWMKEEYVEKVNAGYVVDVKGNINGIASILDCYQREGKKALVKNLEMRMKRANAG